MTTDLAQGVAASAEVVAAILAVAITVVAIVVELAATRFSHRITFLFVREPLNGVFLGFLMVTTLLCLWVGFGLADIDHNRAVVVTTVVFISLSLILVVPYLGWVFTFISPISVISTLRRRATRAVQTQDVAKMLRAIDELQEIARSAIGGNDRGIALSAVDALTAFLSEYEKIRTRLPDRWFSLNDIVREDADFLSLEHSGLAGIERTKLWVEVKVFRQLLALLTVAIPNARDVANAIGINTRRIGATASPDLRQLVFRCFNSYLRSTINAGDPRSSYYLFHQYRLLGEHYLHAGDAVATGEIARNFQFYGLLGYQNQQGFLLEVAAHDLVELIRLSIALGGAQRTHLLDSLLEMDQNFRTETQEQSLTGVRREQLIAAAMFAHAEYESDLSRLLEDLSEEDPARLQRIFNQLLNEDRVQYWEFTDRGTNFSYLQPELRPHLKQVIHRLGILGS